MLVLQVLANNKFLGYLFTVIFLVSKIALAQLHFDHHLYDFGGAPQAKYSDMNGYGHLLAHHLRVPHGSARGGGTEMVAAD